MKGRHYLYRDCGVRLEARQATWESTRDYVLSQIVTGRRSEVVTVDQRAEVESRIL
jgi:hypothetical protein